MKNLFKCTVIILFSLALGQTPGFSQEVMPDSAKIGTIGMEYVFETSDGTRMTGTLLEQDELTMTFHVKKLGDLRIHKEQIEIIRFAKLSKEELRGYWFPNPNATRYFFAPTAIPLNRGEGYYQNIYLFGNMINVGVTDHLSIGGGFDFISLFGSMAQGEFSPMFTLNAKLGLQVSQSFYAGGGFMYIHLPYYGSEGDANPNLGICYGIGTVGSRNSNISAGLGWGFNGADFQEKPFIMIGAMGRISEKAALVTENWCIPGNEYYIVFSYGIRFFGRSLSVDLGFVNSKDIMEVLAIGIPYVDFVVKFGGPK